MSNDFDIDPLLRECFSNYYDNCLHYNRRAASRMFESLSVNPESIEALDIISTPHGIARVGWVNNERGYLAYAPMNDKIERYATYTKESPIRSVRLLRKEVPTSGEQLSLPFVTEQVEAAIYERDQRLNELRDATFSKAKPRSSEPKAAPVKKTMTEEDKQLLQLLAKLSKDDLKKLGL